MNVASIRNTFTNFFKKKGHTIIPSSSLYPQEDPTVLLTTAGMQQFKPYFVGLKNAKADFGNTRLASVQRCFRTSDIDEVGDASHLTFFEMLGNFSVGDYFKKDAVTMAWEFLTKELHISAQKLWITYFSGDDKSGEDSEAVALWLEHVPREKIIGFGRKDNWWGPPGTSGPCGPCSEIHYDFTGIPCAKGNNCQPNCECGRFMEVWNLVFTEFYQDEKGAFTELPMKNIDTGMGLERLALILQKKHSVFDIDVFAKLIHTIRSDDNFGQINEFEDTVRSRIIADHLKGVIFLLADGIVFSNKEQGYIARRIFRRALDQYLHQAFTLEPIISAIINTYHTQYPQLSDRRSEILEKIDVELSNYQKILAIDVQQTVEKIVAVRPKPSQTDTTAQPSSRSLTATEAFKLYTTYGLSPERLRREGFTFDQKKFEAEVENHQSVSRAGAQKKFGGHGLTSNDWSPTERDTMTKLHTATHLLHQALRIVLGTAVQQEGSDINPERLRFDFKHPDKLTPEQKEKIESIINEKIAENLTVKREEMSYQHAIDSGALAFFKEKYPDTVSVYSIGDFSREICGGPHVEHTGVIGHFKIVSEKSSSAGIRRIKAVIA